MESPFLQPDPHRFDPPGAAEPHGASNGDGPSSNAHPSDAPSAGLSPDGTPPHPGRRPVRRRGRDTATGSLFPEPVDTAAPSGPGTDAVWRDATAEEGILLRGALQCSLSPETFLTWFTRSRLTGHEGEAAVLAVPNDFARDWIERHYDDVLNNCAVAVLGAGSTVRVRTVPEAFIPTGHSAAAAPGAPAADPHDSGRQDPTRHAPHAANPGSPSFGAPAQPAAAVPPTTPSGVIPSPRTGSAPPARARASQPAAARNVARRLHQGSDLVLNPKCTFDSFVVGPCNRFGHAAALGASEQPGKSYNPLFLHGRVGVGKTHLLQAFCHTILDHQPDARILYLSCETFVNHFIDALENGNTQEFREKYRNIDLLVVDDVQVLANKEKTQEEFFHTFNSLYNGGKQIVLSSDSPPKDIPTLQDRLVSRFKWGMVTELEPPCYETRMAIVKRKARERGVELPDAVIEFIASNIEENVREIEGAVTRLVGYTALSNSEL
ncbi:MAG: chromosomal replication initiator protein DnaA, partial [Planctomycetota bacterium]